MFASRTMQVLELEPLHDPGLVFAVAGLGLAEAAAGSAASWPPELLPAAADRPGSQGTGGKASCAAAAAAAAAASRIAALDCCLGLLPWIAASDCRRRSGCCLGLPAFIVRGGKCGLYSPTWSSQSPPIARARSPCGKCGTGIQQDSPQSPRIVVVVGTQAAAAAAVRARRGDENHHPQTDVLYRNATQRYTTPANASQRHVTHRGGMTHVVTHSVA